MRRRFLLILALALLATGGGVLAYRAATAYPENFATVVPGRLYRSGEVAPAQLERLQRDAGLRTVLSLLNPDTPESAAERAAAERLGLRWLNVPLTGDGASTPEQRDRIRAIVLDSANQPLLVHCAAGANRTGLAVGMYRIWHDGWSAEQVLAEMRTLGFRDKPHHENLRSAIREEAARAAQTTRAAEAAPAAAPPLP